jgi:tRNA(fMet)-specific endonuclease VapC
VRYLLDTDVVSFVAKRNEPVIAKLLGTSNWVVSSITAYELTKGIEIRGDGAWADGIRQLLEIAEIMPFDERAALAAGRVSAQLRSIGRPSGLADELIAGHAVALGATLVTNNTRHFENVPGLRLESWL